MVVWSEIGIVGAFRVDLTLPLLDVRDRQNYLSPLLAIPPELVVEDLFTRMDAVASHLHLRHSLSRFNPTSWVLKSTSGNHLNPRTERLAGPVTDPPRDSVGVEAL